MESFSPSLLPATLSLVLAGIASTSAAMASFVRTVRAAQTDLAALARELADLWIVLRQLRDGNGVVSIPKALHATELGLLESCIDVLAQTDMLLGYSSSGEDPTAAAAWTWRGRDGAAQVKARMECYRVALALVVDVGTLTTCDSPNDAAFLRNHIISESRRMRRLMALASWDKTQYLGMQDHVDCIASFGQPSSPTPLSPTRDVRRSISFSSNDNTSHHISSPRSAFSFEESGSQEHQHLPRRSCSISSQCTDGSAWSDSSSVAHRWHWPLPRRSGRNTGHLKEDSETLTAPSSLVASPASSSADSWAMTWPRHSRHFSLPSRQRRVGAHSRGHSHSASTSSRRRVQLVSACNLVDKDKPQGIFFLALSPSGATVLSKHGNSHVKVWPSDSGRVKATIKFSAFVQARLRSREFFVRGQAVVSEAATLLAVSAAFGTRLEVWDWTRGKSVQVIADASRWACLRDDAYLCSGTPSLAVYREKEEHITLYRHETRERKPFVATSLIDLATIDGLPFIPKYPELVFANNATSTPTLVAAAGPRPGDPQRIDATMLLAWHVPSDPTEVPRLYRSIVPTHVELHRCLPACVAAEGTTSVSVWIPPIDEVSSTISDSVAALHRFVVVWDMQRNETQMYAIPNAPAAVSGNCRLLAYCDVSARRFVVLDALSGEELWCSSAENENGHVAQQQVAQQVAQQVGQQVGQQSGLGLLQDLGRITDFQFADDGSKLVVGDETGAAAVYHVREGAGDKWYLVPD